MFKRVMALVFVSMLLLSVAIAEGATYVVTGAPHGLNVRETEGGKIQGTIKDGAVVRVTGKSKFWYQIRYDGKTGYVYKDYLEPATYEQYASEEKPKREPFVPPTLNDGKFLYRALTEAKVFEKKDKNSRQVGVFNAGDTVYVSKTWKYWYQVVIDGERYAYVEAKDLEFVGVNLPEVGELKIITSRTEGLEKVYVRAEASDQAKVVKKLSLGSNVRVIEYDGVWAKIVYDSEGNSGYVYKKNIK